MERETNTEPSSPAELPTDDRSRVAADTNGNRNSVDNGQNKDGETEESFGRCWCTTCSSLLYTKMNNSTVERFTGKRDAVFYYSFFFFKNKHTFQFFCALLSVMCSFLVSNNS